MNIKELKLILHEEKFNPKSYAINKVEQSESFCINYEGGAWHVYYSERGNRVDEATFLREEDACDHFLKMLRDDPTTKI